MADIRISALPQVATQRQPVLDRAAAQRQNYGFTAAASNSNLEGLVNGLAALNPELRRRTDMAINVEAAAANAAGVAEANRMEMSGIAEKELLATPLPSSVPPAFDNAFRVGLKGVLGDRAGASVKADIVRAYSEQKDAEGFDPAKFLAEARANAMAGFADPEMAAKVGSQVNQIEVAIRNDVETKRMKQQAEAVDAALVTVVQDKLSPTATVEELAATYHNEVLPAFRAVSKSPKDAQEYLLAHLTNMSAKLGGAPQLFDMFDMPGPEGKSLSSFNSPEMASKIRSAREHATSVMDRNITEATQKSLFEQRASLDKVKATNPAAITPELVMGLIGPHNQFRTFESAAAYLADAQREVQDQLGIQELQGSWDAGELFRHKPEEQVKLIEKNIGPQLDALAGAFRAGNPTEVAQLSSVLAQEVARRGASVVVPSIKRMIETVTTGGENKDGPPPGFQSLVELHKAFSVAPKFRAEHFTGDIADIMEVYTRQVSSGVDPKAAYAAAYSSVSPEAKATAEAYAKTPEFAKWASAAVDEVIGSSVIPQWMGGAGRNQNIEAVNVDTKASMMQFMRMHPNAHPDTIKAFAENHVKSNWVHDETTRTAIKVPPQFANADTQEAITAFSKKLMEDKRVKDLPGDWSVGYQQEGSEGQYRAVLLNNGVATQLVGRINLQTIKDAHYNEKHIDHKPTTDGSLNEGQKLGLLNQQIQSGQIDPNFVASNQALIAKARLTGAIPKATLAKLDKMQAATMLQRIKEVPQMTFGKPDPSAITEIKQRGVVKVDSKLTATMARQFAMTGPAPGATGLAASLITMSEGVVKYAYDDPAHGAGKNIGAGYNLNANKDNVHSDLKRAGVPESQIQGIIDGKFQMTDQQVQRLTQVTVGRYESLAKDTAEKTSPGLWRRMTDAQKAVMTDVAYQVGSTDQFRKAWAALAAGDNEAFLKEAATTYVNKQGQRVPDKRRNGLRSAMLGGLATWDVAVSKYGSLPSNALEVAALNSK